MSAHSRSRGPSPSDSPTHTSRLSPDLPDQPPSAGLSTPPDELNGSDIKNSRKREREVSLEPATPQATTLEIGSETLDPKERRTPAKKNRTSDSLLEAPQEQAEDDHKLNGSPPHETKVRQISQGVEDLTWQNLNKDAPPDLDLTSKLSTSPTDLETNMETVTDPQLPSAQEDKIPPSVDTNSESDHQREAIVPPLARGENPPILSDTAGLEEDTVAAAGAEHPTDSHAPGAPGPSIETTPVNDSRKSIPDAPRFPSTQRRDSDSDQEKGLKRKLGDRTVSEALVPGDIPGGNGAATVGAMKRPRDDPEADPNTREKKRPTPPPDEDDKQEKTTSTTPPPDVTPKFGGFMAYASTTSPFSNVSGPRIFGAKQPSTSPWAAASTSGSPTTSAFSSGGTASSFSSFASSTPPFSGASDFVGKDARDVSSSAASLSQAHKRTGFEAFSSSTSPFASAAKRPKSPPPTPSSVLRSRSPSRHGTPARSVNAFSAYAAGGAQGFAAPTPKRSPPLGEATSSGEPNVLGGSSSGHAGSALDGGKDSGSGEESESGKEDKKKGASFKEQLRAGKDREEEDEDEEQKRLNLTEQEVHTGEEEEDTVYQVRGKLFALSEANQWKERGTGMLRLNVRSEDGGGARLIMRKEAVYTVLLNATLFKGMRCFSAQDPRYIRFSVFEGNTTTHYNLRVSNAKIAEELLEEITAHIPTE
ncbi:hypothetical protein GSI_11707 [Ganoderma sinense ZZ0214-1]|uniref:RanBD1 domain-containing protein n=1 Tax=Ganoderma sinense ZZ0214-1 TaxID=1077348 RepID=A0A2G8RWR2_9APHY|nr:hypothetical protein GSI_11707 [Ganoderma sinense ZZ0214-1]